MANKEIVLKFKAKVDTDVGNIKTILANLESQMQELTIPESNFKEFKKTLEKINKELLNFESLTEKGTDNLTDTKKIEKSWDRVTTLLYNVQGQLKNLGGNVDIFPKTVLDNITKATTLLDKYNEKLKKVRESEAYVTKAAELSSKKEESKQKKKNVQDLRNKASLKEAAAIAKEQTWREREQKYNDEMTRKAEKMAEKEREQAILDQWKREREQSGLFTSQHKITAKTSQRIANAQKVIKGDDKKSEQGTEQILAEAQKDFDKAKRSTAAAKGLITKYQKKSQKSETQLKEDQNYLQLIDSYNKKLKEQEQLYETLVVAENRHKQALNELATAEQEKAKANTIQQNIKASQDNIASLDQEIQKIDDIIEKLNKFQEASSRANQEFEETNKEVGVATSQYNECEQAVERLTQELKQMEIDQSSEDWEELVKTIKELTGIDLTDFSGEVDEVVKALEKYKTDELEKTPSIASKAETAFNGMTPAIKNVTNAADDLNRELTETERRAQEIGQVKDNIMDFFSISNTIDIFKDSVRNAFDTVKELDAVMTEMAVVTDYSIEDMWGKLPEYSKMASELGVATKEFYEAITLYFQQGLSEQQSVDLAVETLKMGRIAGMEGAEATEAMTAALRGFNMELNQVNAQRVNDVYSKLAAVTASDANQIATAISKTASIASSANMDLETTAAFLAQIIETTQEAPETAGTALKTIIARFSEVKELQNQGQTVGVDEEGEEIDVNKIETALKSIGISMDAFFAGEQGLDEIFLELSKKWDTLDFETQHYIATVAAGSRQQSRFMAMMSDYDRTIELVGEAYNSTGASQEQFDKTMESLSSKLNQLQNAWTTFTMGLANSEIIKGVIDFLTNILNLVNDITEKLSGSNGLIRSVFNAYILFKTLSLGKNLVNGAGGIIGSFLGGGATAGAATATAATAGAAATVTSKLSPAKTMKWLIAASLGGAVSEAFGKIFSKEDEDKKEDKKETTTTVVKETDNSDNSIDNSNNSVNNSDNSVNTTEVINNYPTLETSSQDENQALLEAYKNGTLNLDNLDEETLSKLQLMQVSPAQTESQVPKTQEVSTSDKVLNIPSTSNTLEAQAETKTETDTKEDESKADWGAIASGVLGLATTFGSQLLLEAGGQFLANKFSGKTGKKNAGDTTKITKKKKIDQIDMSILGSASDLNVLSEAVEATATTNKKGKLKDLLGQKGGIKSLVTENEKIKKIAQKMDDFLDSSASFIEKQYSKVPAQSVTVTHHFRDDVAKKTEYNTALLKWADLNNKTLTELTDEDLDLFKNASYFSHFFEDVTETFEVPKLNRSDFSSGQFIWEVIKDQLPQLIPKVTSQITPYLGTIGSVTAVAAPVAIAAGLTQKAYQASQGEGRLENLQKIQDSRQEDLGTKQNYLNELNSAKTTYDTLRQLAEDFGEGTDEAKWAIAEIERHADNLLKKYPELAKYAKNLAPENTADIFKQENWSQVIAESEKEVGQAQKAADVNKEEIENLTKELIVEKLVVGTGSGSKFDHNMAEFADSSFFKNNYDSMGQNTFSYIDEYYKDMTKGTQEQFTYLLEAMAQTGLTFTEDSVQNAELLINKESEVREAFNQVLADNGIVLSDWQKEGEDLFGAMYYSLDLFSSTLYNETLAALRNFANETNNAAAASANKAAADSQSASVSPQYLVDAAVERYRSSVTSDPVSSSIAKAEAAEQAQQSTSSGASAAETEWENNFDRIYNLIESIEEETRARQRIENQYEFMLRIQNATANKILELNVQELLSLEKSRQQQKELIEQRMADIAVLQLKNQNLAGYASVEKNAFGDSVLRINWDAIEQITDESLGQAVSDYISQLEEWLDAIYDAEDTLVDIENSVLDIKERGKQEYLDFENRVKDAVEAYYQEEIDKLSEINNTIDDTNSRIIDSIQKYVSDQRKQRDNEKTEKELEKKQRRLSQLRQDTSNANQTEILTLQEEITVEQENYTDTLIDQKISELQEQNELAQEQRQQQIEIAQAQLEHYVSTGEIWKEVQQLMDEGLNPDGGIIGGSKLIEILQNAENFQGLSAIGQMKWMEDLSNDANLAQVWALGGAVYQSQANDILTGMQNEIANLDVGSTTVNNYYSNSSSNSSDYGNNSYGDSSEEYTNNPTIPTIPTYPNVSNSSDSSEQYHIVVPPQSFFTGGDFIGKTVEEAMKKAINQLTEEFNKEYKKISNIPGLGEEQKIALQKELIQTQAALVKFIRNTSNYRRYKTGGLANFTGPAWLDGTKAKPEYVLNSVQTKGFLTLVDVLESIKNHTSIPKTENAVGNTYDIDINIETVKEEADIDKIAEKVQKSIVTASQYRSNTIIKR